MRDIIISKTLVRAKETPNGVNMKVRDENGVNVESVFFNNYFFLLIEERSIVNSILQEEKLDKWIASEEIFNDTHYKIYLKHNYMRNKIKNALEKKGVTTYEADILTPKRWLLDNDYIPMNSKNLRWLFYDIETKDDGLFLKDDNNNVIANEPILSISYIDCDMNVKFIKNEGYSEIKPDFFEKLEKTEDTEIKSEESEESEVLEIDLEKIIDGEKELLLRHKEIMKSYDIILGWNSTDFDDRYVKERNEFHDITNTEYDNINELDYMNIFKKMYFPKLDSYKLDSVAKEVLRLGKVDLKEKGKGGIFTAWKNSFKECKEFGFGEIVEKFLNGEDLGDLKSYNFIDVYLLYKLEEKMDFINAHKEISEYSGSFIQETFNNSDTWDIILLKDLHKDGLVWKSKPRIEEIERRKKLKEVAGAYTFCRYKGLHENEESFDYKSFYPTTATAFNISFDTIGTKEFFEENNIPYCIIPDDYHTMTNEKGKEELRYFPEKYFRTDKRGYMAERFFEMINLRDKIKYEAKKIKESDEDLYRQLKSKEVALKVMANAGYGFTAFGSSRFYNPDVANSITQTCRNIIKGSIDLLECNVGENRECKNEKITKCVLKTFELLGIDPTNESFKIYIVTHGDTDSVYGKRIDGQKMTKEEIKKLEHMFYVFYDLISKELDMNSKTFDLKNPLTNELESKNHFIVFEHEQSVPKIFVVKKKNYASLTYELDGDGNASSKPKIKITGLECIKKDTNPLAKILQKEIIHEMLLDKFNVESFEKKLEKIKQKFINNEIDEKYLIMQKTLNKSVDSYGKEKIDKKTGKVKLSKDGEKQFAPVPAHVQLAKKMIERGEEVYVGQNIQYIVKESNPKIVPISVEEYRNGEEYDREYYWERVITPIIKVLVVENEKFLKKNPYIWTMKEFIDKKTDKIDEKKYVKNLERIIKKLE